MPPPRAETSTSPKTASPVVLMSAGVGATPVLAMLHALAAEGSQREIRWVHTTHDRESQPFTAEVARLIDGLPHARQRVFYTAEPGRSDRTPHRGIDRSVGPAHRCRRIPLRPKRIHG